MIPRLLPFLLLSSICLSTEAAPTALINTTIAGARVSYLAVRLNDPHIKVQVEVCQGFPSGDEPFSDMVRRLRPVAAINGAYFSKQTKQPVGDIVRDGRVLYRGDFGTALSLTPNRVPAIRRVVLGHATDWGVRKRCSAAARP